jgi:hypothetical protein
MTRNANSKVIADGSLYINENFSPIYITQYKDKLYSAIFNASNAVLEFKIDNDKVISLDRKAEFEVVFTSTNKTYRTVDYIDQDSNSRKEFLVVFSEHENHSLFKEERIKYFEKVTAASSYQQNKPARYKRDDDLYYLKLNDHTNFVPQSKKDFLKAFPKQSKKLKSYMKENKLNPKNEDERIAIIKYLSTIVE